MRKSLFFSCILVAFLAIIFLSGWVKTNEQCDSARLIKDKPSLIYAKPVAFPARNTNDPHSGQINVTMPLVHAEMHFCVRVNHILFCLFEMANQETSSEHGRTPVDIALNGFFLTLFNSIIAPNAP
jgi:hypothetical protein